MSETEKDAIDNAQVKELANWKNNQAHIEVEGKIRQKFLKDG